MKRAGAHAARAADPLAANDQSLARVLVEAKEASQERRKRELGVFLREGCKRLLAGDVPG